LKNNVTLLLLLFSLSTFAQENFKRTLILMGSRFDITVVASNEKEGNKYIDSAIFEIARIEKLISSWDVNSETSLR
jgi:thiamine biosynthesis lipoprotein